jgi:hypothetical protein
VLHASCAQLGPRPSCPFVFRLLLKPAWTNTFFPAPLGFFVSGVYFATTSPPFVSSSSAYLPPVLSPFGLHFLYVFCALLEYLNCPKSFILNPFPFCFRYSACCVRLNFLNTLFLAIRLTRIQIVYPFAFQTYFSRLQCAVHLYLQFSYSRSDRPFLFN